MNPTSSVDRFRTANQTSPGTIGARAGGRRVPSPISPHGNSPLMMQNGNNSPTKILNVSERLGADAKRLLDRGDREGALRIAEQIPDEGIREDLLSDISVALNAVNEEERAIVVAMKIPNRRKKWDTLSLISQSLRNDHRINRAIEVALMISDETKRFQTLVGISAFLQNHGMIDRATDVALMISDERIREQVFRNILGSVGVTIVRTILVNMSSEKERSSVAG
ncbi:MAG TPA: hypothetical protein VJK48_02275 [Chlamydiales bacterium]|nr:hypothetical protein [Chlamydiales bacterium]